MGVNGGQASLCRINSFLEEMAYLMNRQTEGILLIFNMFYTKHFGFTLFTLKKKKSVL